MSYILSALQKAEQDRRRRRGFNMDELGVQPLQRHRAAGSASSTGGRVGLTIAALGLVGTLGALVPWLYLPAPADPAAEDIVRQQADETHVQAVASEVRVSEAAASTAQPDVNLPQALDIQGIILVQGQPGASRVLLAGRALAEGDELEPGLRVVSIEATRIILSVEGEQKSYSLP